jgi:multiple sugar transport system permease protein
MDAKSRLTERGATPWPAFWLAAPAQALIGLIIFVPALYVFRLSLTQSSFGQAPVFVGLANYAKVLGDPYFWRTLGNTILVVFVVVHVGLLLGIGIALLFASGVRATPLLLAAALAP